MSFLGEMEHDFAIYELRCRVRELEALTGGGLRPRVRFKRLPHGEGLPLPAYETDGAAGMDLRAAEFALMHPGATRLIGCGFAVEIPPSYVGLMFIRSSVALRGNLMLANTVGVIDSDFRGEIKMAIRYETDSDLDTTIEVGDRIAQLVIAPVARAVIEEAEELTETDRGAGGFGSTGRV